jgi:hypothetical protein
LEQVKKKNQEMEQVKAAVSGETDNSTPTQLSLF